MSTSSPGVSPSELPPSEQPGAQQSTGLIGNDTARAVHGFSAGADCALLGGSTGTGPARTDPADADRWAEIVAAVCRPSICRPVRDLAELAELAAGSSNTDSNSTEANNAEPLILLDPRLQLELPATLDLLDSPGDRTAALLADPRNIEAPTQPEHDLDRATPARVNADALLAAIGPGDRSVGGVNRVVIGLVRIRAADRGRAAEIWRQAAAGQADSEAGSTGAGPTDQLFDRALRALIDSGLPVRAQNLGYYTWSRGDAGQTGLGGSAWQQRLRSASRLGDGAYSAAVVRPLSRIGTRFALRGGLTPNVVTMISLAVGIVSGLLIMTGRYPLWVVAAIVLQLALVIDCMDGEIARFTRRFSAFGGWLDGVGDRIKEYLVFAALAVVVTRQGHPNGWLLAMIAMVVVTARHLEDYAYTDRATAVRASGRSTGSGSPTGPAAGSGLPAPASRRQRISFWAKKIAHVPIAERYLILSLGLLTGHGIWVLVAAIVVSAFALAWVIGGRLLRAVRTPHPPLNQTLDHQLDVGRAARLATWLPLGYLPGLLVLIVCWLACIVGICTDLWPLALITAVVGVPLTGSSFREPSCHRFGWLGLPVVWGLEAAVIGSLLSWSVPGVLLFCVLAAVAYRRYELIYSIRLRGVSGPAPVLGFDGRILLIGVLVTMASLVGTPQVVLNSGLILIGAETLVEAVVGTVRRWRRPLTAHATL